MLKIIEYIIDFIFPPNKYEIKIRNASKEDLYNTTITNNLKINSCTNRFFSPDVVKTVGFIASMAIISTLGVSGAILALMNIQNFIISNSTALVHNDCSFNSRLIE